MKTGQSLLRSPSYSNLEPPTHRAVANKVAKSSFVSVVFFAL